MAAAMARGWAGADGDSPSKMLFTDSGSGRATALAEEVGGKAVDTNEQLVSESDFVVLAVKPAALGTGEKGTRIMIDEHGRSHLVGSRLSRPG